MLILMVLMHAHTPRNGQKHPLGRWRINNKEQCGVRGYEQTGEFLLAD
ncbi:MAG TPA: hypothetical protein VGN34_23945 [Ktedonobacteraceae bacterium]|jgi:hypothetical protein